MRTIDADKLSEAIHENVIAMYEESVAAKEDCLREIEDAPTIDAVPVVRCKKCRWFADNNDGEWYGCQMFGTVLNNPEDAPKPDGFCSYGERKENNHEKV